MTAFPAEQAILDSGTTIKGWTRTGQSFKVDRQGAVHARVSVEFAREFGWLLEAAF